MVAPPRVFVVIPAYRCAPQVGGVISAMPELVERIFVVDDASPDDTAAVVEGLGNPRVTLLRHEVNQGVGGAMATGYRAALDAGADIVVKVDGDGQMAPSDIPALVEPLLDGTAEYAKATRFHHFRELRSMPRARLLGNIGLTFLTKLSSGYWHVLDPQNGFVAICAPVLRRVSLDRLAQGYFFENDMLIRLNAVEARVADVPLHTRYGDEESNLKPGRILLQFPARLLAGFFRRVFWRYLFFDVSPIALFLLFGIVLFAFGGIFGAYHWWKSIHTGVTASTGTVILSALPLILGFQLILQALVLDVQGSPRPGPRADRPKA